MPVAPQKKSRMPIIIAVVVAVVVLCGGGIVAFALIGSSVSGTDSGVTACKTLAEDSDDSSTDGDDSSSDDALTKTEYNKIRGQFADSKHSDLRSSGTKFMDLAWKLGGEDADQDQGLDALALLGEFEGDYTALAAACGNHGVTLQPLDLSDGE